jgi:hypothetical protein
MTSASESFGKRTEHTDANQTVETTGSFPGTVYRHSNIL